MNSLREKELADEIRKKSQRKLYELIDALSKKEIEFSSETESKLFEDSLKQLIDVIFWEDKFSEEERKSAGENIKKVIDWKLGQSNQATSSNKKEYPWPIISMGVVIAA